MKSNIFFALVMGLLVVGVCCKTKVTVNGKPVTSDFYDAIPIDYSAAKPKPKPKHTPGDTTKIGIVLDCTRCKDKTVSTTLDGVIWTGYKVRVKISETATATKFLMPDKTQLPNGCRIIQVVKL